MTANILFDAPEFYPQNQIVMRVEGPHGIYLIISEGERDVQYRDLILRTPQQFRDAFPDGRMPEQSDTFVWHYNAWFAVYEERDNEVLGEPMMSLAEAITYALDLAYGEL